MTTATDEPQSPYCFGIPEIGDDLKIRLPFGGELQAIRDFTKGIPDDCSMVFSLTAQLPPLLGSLHCLLAVLKLVGVIGDFMEAAKSADVLKIAEAAGKVVDAIKDLTPCLPIPAGAIPNIICMIRDILLLIAKLLRCALQFIDSLVNFQLTIDIETAADNPPLLDVMQCAQDNASLTIQHVLAGLKIITPLLDAIKPLGEIAQISLEIPVLDLAGADPDIGATLDKLRTAAEAIEKAAEAIPC